MYDMRKFVGNLPNGKAVFIGDTVWSDHTRSNVVVESVWVDCDNDVYIKHNKGIALIANCGPMRSHTCEYAVDMIEAAVFGVIEDGRKYLKS